MANGNKGSNIATRAKTAIILDHVFFATLILRLIFIQDDNISTACTNGKEVRYSQEYFNKLNLKEVIAVFAHEILHCVFGHHTRRGNRDPRIWNIACDLAINPLLLEYGFQLPSGCLLDPTLKGMTAEEIYNRIMRDNNGLGKYKAEGVSGDCGGLGTVEDAIGEDGQPAEGAEKNYQETDWKIASAQAANLAAKAGQLPAGMKRSIDYHISPLLPWEEILYRFVDSNSFNDFSWAPPNRKYMNSGIYLPSVRSKELKNITLGCDASGSVRDAELGLIASALEYLQSVYNPKMEVLWFDTKVHDTQVFEQYEPITLEPKGGGGTDFRAPFKWLEENDVTPNVMIMFTDMECDRYPEQPDFPVIWVTWKKEYHKPPFGEVIVM